MVKLTPIKLNEVEAIVPPVDEDPVELDYIWQWNFTTNVAQSTLDGKRMRSPKTQSLKFLSLNSLKMVKRVILWLVLLALIAAFYLVLVYRVVWLAYVLIAFFSIVLLWALWGLVKQIVK